MFKLLPVVIENQAVDLVESQHCRLTPDTMYMCLNEVNQSHVSALHIPLIPSTAETSDLLRHFLWTGQYRIADDILQIDFTVLVFRLGSIFPRWVFFMMTMWLIDDFAFRRQTTFTPFVTT